MHKAFRTYDSFAAPEAEKGGVLDVPVAIIGAGPIGLTAAIDLARKGVRSVVLERGNAVSDGSRAICFAKRVLEIYDRLGIGDALLEAGVTWNRGLVYAGDDTEPVFGFNLLPEEGHKFPAFINLQQYRLEERLVAALVNEAKSEIRWANEVSGIQQGADSVTLDVRSEAGDYKVEAEYVIAADGHRSPTRDRLGLDFRGRQFEDNFLIADVRFKRDMPAIRRFWFDPPFNRGQSALMHRQPEDVWRLDFQLGPDVDRDEATKPENVAPRVRAMLGEDVEFEFVWISIYNFQCRRMDRFLHDRVIFAGDAAHIVSPFGARGANSGIQDVDNLVWKLSRVLAGSAPAGLLESYDSERTEAADENIGHSTRATDFISPKGSLSRAFRDGVLELARDYEFARAFVNSGRLSTPTSYRNSPLSTPDEGTDGIRPGAPAKDSPFLLNGAQHWLLNQLGEEFVLLVLGYEGLKTRQEVEKFVAETATPRTPLRAVFVEFTGGDGDVFRAAEPFIWNHYCSGGYDHYLFRPDQHVAARWRGFDADKVAAAVKRAAGKDK